ncbi:MAG: LOG family protein, partial [Acidimicrobiia bacterium]|nr:LOG family protein [Acidimicrobiia bacterium]
MPYDLGDSALDAKLKDLVDSVLADGNHHASHTHDNDIIGEMLVSGLKMLRDDTDRGDLKLVNSALKEMRYSFVVFSQYRNTPKVTIFGSARTQPEDPNYKLAAEFARTMTDARWMVITGAGPGIMEAGNLGAGQELGFGVNIRLPFESEPNEYIHESRVINFKYFFTRKLMFVKESDAFAIFP